MVIFYIVKNEVRYPVKLWRPKNHAHGDYSTDAAFSLAKAWNAEPVGGPYTVEDA